MKVLEGVSKKFKEFKPTSWVIDNRTATYIITILISLYGLTKFNTMPKEQFPDIVVPTISVTTVYFGNSAKFWLGIQDDFDLEEEQKAKSSVLKSIKSLPKNAA